MIRTTNGALAYETTENGVYDLFALGGSYRSRSDEDICKLMQNALEDAPTLAMKCLFYLRDCREGQGERRFFRVAFRYLLENSSLSMSVFLPLIQEYGRWDDLIYTCLDTRYESEMVDIVKDELKEISLESNPNSLIAKWMPSENASATETKNAAKKMAKLLGLTNREYRKLLSRERAKLDLVETKLVNKEEIDLSKVSGVAALKIANSSAENVEMSGNINTATLTPSDIGVWFDENAMRYDYHSREFELKHKNRDVYQNAWDNLKDYFGGNARNILPMVDTSQSMYGTPFGIAVGLGVYCAEKSNGMFKDKVLTFSDNPQFFDVSAETNSLDKMLKIKSNCIVEDTNIKKAFMLVLDAMKKSDDAESLDSILVFSDMQINSMTEFYYEDDVIAEMSRIRREYERAGIKMPKLVYWNVNAVNDAILDKGPDVTLVSGRSPVIIEQILSGKTGVEVMIDKLMDSRYADVTW